MITNAQLIKMLLGLRLHDGGVAYLGGEKVTLTGLAITIHGDTTVDLKWDDINAEKVRAFWHIFSDLYNKPVMCVVDNNGYLTSLLNDSMSKSVRDEYSDVLCMRLITLVSAGYEYRIVSTPVDSEDSLFVVNRTHLPQTEYCICDPTMRVESVSGNLTLGHMDDVDGMCMCMSGLYVQELSEMLGFDLFDKVIMFGTVLGGRERTRGMSTKQTDFPEIAHIFYSSENSDTKYDRLIQGLKCLGDDIPDRLNAILESMGG